MKKLTLLLCALLSTVITTNAQSLSVSTLVSANDRCYGGSTGSATATASHGTSPYTYLWTPGSQTTSTATALTAATYTIKVTDHAGSTATATATITQPSALSVSASVTANVTCFGGSTGSVKSTPSNGTSPYTYSWSGGGTNSTKTGLAAGTYTITVTDNCGATVTASTSVTQPSVLTVSASATANVTCNGGSNGSVSATLSGGTSPYTYSWSGGGTNSTKTALATGTYTITVTDNCGATATASTTVTQPSALSFSANVTANVSCYGGSNGSASVSPTGGTSPYTYSWSPGGGTNFSLTGLTAGTYSVFVTDNNGCGSPQPGIATITQPAVLSVSANVTANVSCNGGSNGSISSSPTGGTSPYTYSWSGGGTNSTKTGLTAGTYTISITDNNGCTATASATITQPTAVAITISSQTNLLCNGVATGSATANAASGGVSPYTYIWSPSGGSNLTASSLSAGTYTITATDYSGCTATDAVTLTQPTAVAITIASHINNTICNGADGSATANVANGGTSPYTYNWMPSGGTNLTASGLTDGTYTIIATDNNGCKGTASVTIQNLVLRDSIVSFTSTCVYSTNGTATVGVKLGALPYTYLWNPGGQTNATATGLGAGTYSVTVTDNNGCTGSTSVVISPDIINVSITPSPLTLCPGECSTLSAAVSGGATPYTYAWSGGGGSASTDYVCPTIRTTYTVTVQDNIGCSETATKVAIITFTASHCIVFR